MGTSENRESAHADDSRTAKLQGIEAARGLAALLVAFYHGSHVVQLASGSRTAPLGGFFMFGHAGVPFFFVLSGFIIFLVHRRDINRPSKLGAFAWKRIVRIYPLFVLVMIPITVKYLMAGDFEWDYFIKSLLLLPQARWPMLIPSWTLVHEALFYILFAVAILKGRLSQLMLFAWIVLFCGLKWFKLDFPSGFMGDLGRALFSPYNLLFLFGIVVAWIVQRGPVFHSRLLAGVGCLAFVSIGLAENAMLLQNPNGQSPVLILMYGISSALIITGLAASELASAVRPSRLAGVLGALSYPLYLTHGMTISAVVGLSEKMHYAGPDWFLLFFAVALSCMAAMLVNRFVEIPVARYLKGLRSRRQRTASSNEAMTASELPTRQ